MKKMILTTGGLGFIGSHTVVDLLNEGYDVCIIDNLSNSHIEVLSYIQQITGKMPKFYQGDVRDNALLDKVFSENDISAVIHFAALKAVAESVVKPLLYYEVNIDGTIAILKAMQKHHVHNIIFSSSATVYGDPKVLPCTEDTPIGEIKNPYGETKLINEMLIKDFVKANEGMHAVLLRYFNPIGAHASGLIGEDPKDIPNNLVPYILRVAAKQIDHLTVFGNDYDTPDGSCIRDYIHVCDLAHGHVLAIKKILTIEEPLKIYNLGTGKGTSVLELVNAFKKVNHIDLPYVIGPRRAGDATASYASIDLAKKELGFVPKFSVEDALKDAYHFLIKHEERSKN